MAGHRPLAAVRPQLHRDRPGLRPEDHVQPRQRHGAVGRAAHLAHDAHLSDPATEDVLITARAGRLESAAARPAVAAVTARLGKLTEVSHVDPPVLAKNGQALMVEATISGDPETASDRAGALLKATGTVQKQFPALRVEQVGGASLNNAVNDQVSQDLGAAADFSLPVTLIILLVAFGAIVAAGVPVLLALSAVGSATGLAALAWRLRPPTRGRRRA